MEQDMTKGTGKMIEMIDYDMDTYNAEIQWRIENIENGFKDLKAYPTVINAMEIASNAAELGGLLHTVGAIEKILNGLRIVADTED